MRVFLLEGEEMGDSALRFLVSLPVLGSELRLLSEEAQELARLVVWFGSSAAQAGQANGEARQWPPTLAGLGEQLMSFGRQISASAMAVALALAEQDTQGAQRLWRQQRRLQHELTRLQRSLLLTMPAGTLPSAGTRAPAQPWVAYLSTLALLLKRISSHAATLCERLIFVVEGVRSMRMLQRLEARLLVDRCHEPAQ
jgi:phosphate uptake regulator